MSSPIESASSLHESSTSGSAKLLPECGTRPRIPGSDQGAVCRGASRCQIKRSSDRVERSNDRADAPHAALDSYIGGTVELADEGAASVSMILVFRANPV